MEKIYVQVAIRLTHRPRETDIDYHNPTSSLKRKRLGDYVEEDIELDDGVPEAKRQAHARDLEDAREMQSLRFQPGLLHVQSFSPQVRHKVLSNEPGLFLVSPSGRTSGLHQTVGKRFSARALTKKAIRRRVRLSGSDKKRRRVRELSNLSAKDKHLRSCTALELEEHSKSKLKTLAPSADGTGSKWEAPNFTASPAVPSVAASATPAASASTSIIGAALAEAAKHSNNSAEKDKKTKNPVDDKAVGVPQKAADSTFQFGGGTTSTTSTTASPPIFSFGGAPSDAAKDSGAKQQQGNGPLASAPPPAAPSGSTPAFQFGGAPSPSPSPLPLSQPTFPLPGAAPAQGGLVGGFSLGAGGSTSTSTRRKSRRKR